MKRITLICTSLLVVLACQPLTRVTVPTEKPLDTATSTPEEAPINSTSFIEDDIVFIADEGGDIEVYTIDQDGNNLRKLTNLNGLVWPLGVKWSPNKDTIAFNRLGSDYRTFWVYLMNSDGSDQRPASEAINMLEPQRFEWSPDGKKLAIWGTSGFYIINAFNGEIEYQELLDRPGYFYRNASWSPDGREVAIGTLTGISILDVSGYTINHTINLDGNVDETIWSPDGRRIAFTLGDISLCENADGMFCTGVFVMNGDTSKSTLLLGGEVTDEVYELGGWSSDGKYILIIEIPSLGAFTFNGRIDVETLEVLKVDKTTIYSLLSRNRIYIYLNDESLCKFEVGQTDDLCLRLHGSVLDFDW